MRHRRGEVSEENKPLDLFIHQQDNGTSQSLFLQADQGRGLDYRGLKSEKETRASGMRRLDGITDTMDMNLGKLQELVMDSKAWPAALHGVTKSRTQEGADHGYKSSPDQEDLCYFKNVFL